MTPTRVWVDFLADKPRLLAWKNGCFYSAEVTETDQAVWEERLRDARDPGQVIGPGCQVAPIQLVTRVEVVLGGEASIYYGKTGMQMIKLHLVAGGQQLLDAVKESRPDWRHDVRKASGPKHLMDGLKAVGGFGFFSLFLWVFYFGIESGNIDRAHWLIALIVLIGGTLPLAILAGLCSLLTIALTVMVVLSMIGMAVFKPSETHVLRPAP